MRGQITLTTLVSKSVMMIASAVGVATATETEPNLVESCAEVAVMVAVPAPPGVKTPELLIVPILVGLTDHVTAEL
jgi:hypothetical protein